MPSSPIPTPVSLDAIHNSITTLAGRILEHHAATFSDPGLPPQPVPPARSNHPVYLAALHASSQLGFIAADAQCLAHAWQRQTERTAHFAPDRWPDDPRDFGIATTSPNAVATGAAAAHRFPDCPHALGLYAVLPTAEWVGRMARAGVPTVQLRFKSEDPAAIRAEVQAAVAAVQGTRALLFINDHWHEAIAAGAYGVHLGQEDMDSLPPEALPALRSAGVRLGISTHGYAEMLRAHAAQPSYIALGAVFPTTLKRMPTAPQGLARLRAYVRLMKAYPLVAIGGISADLFPAVRACGVGSIAVVRALVNAPAPEAEAARLLQAMQ